MAKEAITHYVQKRKFLRNYIHLKKKLSRAKKTSKKYEPLKTRILYEKRNFYNSKIDDIKENWNNRDYCPGRKHYRAVKGLMKICNERRNLTT